MNRNRKHYFLFIILTIIMGLLSRTSFIPEIIYPYIGDAFYALMMFFIVGFLFPKIGSIKVALISIAICFAIEFSQLYQADWINQIRSYKLAKLILGHGFLWSDLVSYCVGGFTGLLIEQQISKN